MDNKYNFNMVDTITVSDDEDTRKEKLGKRVTVTFVYKEWTAQDLANRLMVSNSPRVAVQAILRKMKQIPDTYEYIVPKVGFRSAQPVDWFKQLALLVGQERALELSNEFGSAEDAIKAMSEMLKK